MPGSRFIRALYCTAIVLLVGCSTAQIVGPAYDMAGTVKHRQSGTSGGPYLYVASQSGAIYLFEYPSGHQLAEFYVDGRAFGDCRDADGNVFITAQKEDAGSGLIYEFAGGGSSRLKLLTETEPVMDCSYDTATGNLAAANSATTRASAGSVAVYAGAQGSPTLYPAPPYFSAIESVAYDDAGNLFVGGAGKNRSGAPFTLAELPVGTSTFTQISLNHQFGTKYASYNIQWNDGGLAVTDFPGKRKGPDEIYRVSLSGSIGTIVGSTRLKEHGLKSLFHSAWTWIEGNSVLAPTRGGIGIWPYPRGGKAKAFIDGGGAFAEVVTSTSGTF